MISYATQTQPSAAVIRPQIRSQAMRVIRKKKINATHSHARTHMDVYRQHEKLFSVESCRGRSRVYFVVVSVVVAAACVAWKCVWETDINILTYVCHGKLEDATANVLEKLAYISPF